MCLFLERHRVGTIKGTAHSLQLKTKFHISTLIRAMHDMNSSRSDIGDTNRASDRLSVGATFTTFDSRICNKILPERILIVSAFAERSPFVAGRDDCLGDASRGFVDPPSEVECVRLGIWRSLPETVVIADTWLQRSLSATPLPSRSHSSLLPFPSTSLLTFLCWWIFYELCFARRVNTCSSVLNRRRGRWHRSEQKCVTAQLIKYKKWHAIGFGRTFTSSSSSRRFSRHHAESARTHRRSTQQIGIECGARSRSAPECSKKFGGKCVKERTSFEFVFVSEAIKNRWSDNEPN